MKFSATILYALLSQVFAASVTAHWGHRSGFCITDADAELIAVEFGYTVSNYSLALVEQLFAPNFTDQSDSILALVNLSPKVEIPLGELVFDSRAAFIAGQVTQPPIPFEILNVFHTCDVIIVRWVSKQKPLQVQGISILSLEPAVEGEGSGFGAGETKYQIYKVYAELNSAAFLVNLGNPNCANVTAS